MPSEDSVIRCIIRPNFRWQPQNKYKLNNFQKFSVIYTKCTVQWRLSWYSINKLTAYLKTKINSNQIFVYFNHSYGLIITSSTDFIRISLTMAYGIGRTIAILASKISGADFHLIWNLFSDIFTEFGIYSAILIQN